LIYNSLTREKKPFEPLKSGEVAMYACGPTVYDEPHIGHARSAYIFEVIRRYLVYKGYKVKFVRNVTDVDDKIIDKARQEFPGEDLVSAVKKVSTKYLDSYHEALRQLNISQDDIIEPRASEYIPKMIKFIERLIERGVAYQAGGDVYFDITKAKNYGKLSGQSLEKMESGARVSPQENKRDPLDFALWKSAKEGEPSWDSPWGKGRPGWHIECSVMSSDILGDEFDIHGGGLDLIFPHHENEIAQSEGAGKKFARTWIHHGLLTINGQKMAKSLGNFVTIDKFLERHSPDSLKIFFLSTLYSNPVDFTEEKIQEADKARGRFVDLIKRLDNVGFINKESSQAEIEEVDSIKKEFERAMDDDFNTAEAIAALFELTSMIDGYLSEYKKNEKKIIYAKSTLLKLADILGLSFKSHHFKLNLEDNISLKESVELKLVKKEDIEKKISERNKARIQRDFKRADEIRKELEGQGIILEDTKDGTIWRQA
jgi:cysteinyl-tRNA synthetase